MIKIIRQYISRKYFNPLRIAIISIGINLIDQSWIKNFLNKAMRHFVKLEDYYIRAIMAYAINRSQLGKFSLAKKALDHLNIDKIGLNRLHTTAMLYDVSGEIERRNACLLKVERLELDARITTQVDKLGCKIFGSTFRPIGHIALIEIFVKAKLLGLIPNYQFVICEEKDKFANFALVEYWQQYSELITVPSTVKKLQEILNPCEEKLGHIRMCDGSTMNLDQFGMHVQLEWEKSTRDSLLKLTPEHLERGWKYLHSLGMPKDSWFVGLHVRNTISPLSDLRNADIATYTLAINEISARGGWVVRLGGNGDEPIKRGGDTNVIDYALRSDKEDWLDIFMLAMGRFLIGTGSGPSAIPISFGRPVLYTNWGPLQNRQWGRDDLLIPKQYWNHVEKRYLSMYERMGDHSIGRAQSTIALLSKGVEVHDNSPEIIRDAAIEMIKKPQSYVSCERQKKFSELCIMKEVYPTRLSAGFISAYTSFFEKEY